LSAAKPTTFIVSLIVCPLTGYKIDTYGYALSFSGKELLFTVTNNPVSKLLLLKSEIIIDNWCC